MYPATLAFCGSLGLNELDIASLAISVFQLVVVPIENGLRWSCLTFFSQALGGSKKKRAGITVQRSLTAAVCMWCFSFGVAMNCANLLALIGQDKFIAVNSEKFITILMPGCLAVFVFRVQMAYMDCLGRVLPTLFIHMIAFILCVGLQALFIFQFQWGFYGSAVALSITLCTLPVMMTIYIVVSKAHVDTWPGWSTRCFLAWKEFYHNLFPSVANQLVFVFSSEMGTFIAGLLGKPQLAVQGIVFQIFIVTMQPCTGAGSAAISRIGRYMGAGDQFKAKRVYKLILVLLGAVGTIISLFVFALRYEIPKIFSATPETYRIFQVIIYFVCIYIIVISTAWGHTAALRGCNYHTTCVVIAFVSLWLIGHPIGLSLIFAANWGMTGLWTGFVIASVAWNILGLIAVCRVNWDATSRNVSSQAERETDVEGFMSIDERKPLIDRKKSSNSGDHLQTIVENNSAEAKLNQKTWPSDNTLETKCKKKRTSSWKMVKTKIPVFIGICAYVSIAIVIRLTIPQPVIENHDFSNSTTVFTNFTTITSDYLTF